MSTKNGNAEVTQEEAQQIVESFGAVNLDEVTNGYLNIKVSESREVDATDDEGHPLLDGEGKTLKRKEFYTRTAKIYDLVPYPLYNKMVKLRAQIQSKQLSQNDAIAPMGDLVLQVWQRSEEWMTPERFYETVHGETIAALFFRFFAKSRLQNSRA